MANVVALSATQITQSADQVRVRLISQIVKEISRALQNYLGILMVQSFLYLQYHRYQYCF